LVGEKTNRGARVIHYPDIILLIFSEIPVNYKQDKKEPKEMRIFIGHKFRNVDKGGLKEKIEKISFLLEKRGYQAFNYFRDKEDWGLKTFPPDKVMQEAFEELKKCDVFLVFIDSPEKSEGISLESGFARALGKKIILLISKDCSEPKLESIADQVIRFDNWQNIGDKLKLIKI